MQNNITTETPKSLYELNRNYAKQSSSSNCNPIIHEASSTPSLNQQWQSMPNNVEHKQVELMSNLCQSLLDQQRHMPNQFNVPNAWCANYMQTQHSLMLNTISQCCQLLWFQQQDINNLINNVAMVSR